MEDQVAKAKARKKPVKDAVIQAIEPAAIDEVVKLDDTIDTVQPGQEEPAMTEATENTQNPDMVLFEEFQQAQKKIEEWNKRVEVIKEILRKRDANYTDEQIKEVRNEFDAWVGKHFLTTIHKKAIKEVVKLEEWKPNQDVDGEKIHSTVEAFVRNQMKNENNTPTLKELKKLAYKFIEKAKDEEGGAPLTLIDLESLERAFGIVETKVSTTTVKKSGTGKKDTGETGNSSKEVVYPGTDVKFTLSYNSNTRKYSLRGQAGSKLIDELTEKGIQMSKDELKKKIEDYGPKLFPQ